MTVWFGLLLVWSVLSVVAAGLIGPAIRRTTALSDERSRRHPQRLRTVA